MTDTIPAPTDQDLMSEGIKFIDDALCHYLGIDDHQCQVVAKILHGALAVAELIYAIKKVT